MVVSSPGTLHVTRASFREQQPVPPALTGRKERPGFVNAALDGRLAAEDIEGSNPSGLTCFQEPASVVGRFPHNNTHARIPGKLPFASQSFASIPVLQSSTMKRA